MAHDSAGRRVPGTSMNGADLNGNSRCIWAAEDGGLLRMARTETVAVRQSACITGLRGGWKAFILIWKSAVRRQNMPAGKGVARSPENG